MKMKKILLVDDQEIMRWLITDALSDKFVILTAESGEIALKMLDEELPDLILTDLVMPDMNGKELVRRIRENEEWADIPIIFMTSDRDPDTEVECLSMGADDFVPKPLAISVMEMRIQRLLELRDLRRSLEQQLETEKRQAQIAAMRSIQDKLTGLYNREYLKEHFAELTKDGRGGAFYMIDMDNFKFVNDNFGHIAGDTVLQSFGNILKEKCRSPYVPCRIGGDEFIIYAPGLTKRKAAGNLADEIMEATRNCEAIQPYSDKLSLSVGIAFYPEDGKTLQSLYKNSDKALYFVKNNGKDSYHFYKDGVHAATEYNVTTDLDNICRMIESKCDDQTGAITVVYGEFQNLYNFVYRYMERKHQQVQAVLITIMEGDHSDLDSAYMDKAMEDMEVSVTESLRSSDAATKYSDRQFLMILMDTDEAQGRMIAERAVRQFRNEYDEDEVKVYFDLRTVGG
jgi:diguanylate cyclase (GGDEF)-like protein